MFSGLHNAYLCETWNDLHLLDVMQSDAFATAGLEAVDVERVERLAVSCTEASANTQGPLVEYNLVAGEVTTPQDDLAVIVGLSDEERRPRARERVRVRALLGDMDEFLETIAARFTESVETENGALLHSSCLRHEGQSDEDSNCRGEEHLGRRVRLVIACLSTGLTCLLKS